MDTSTLIASGIIENYTLGLATDDEMQLVEQSANASEEVFKILAQNQIALEKYAYAYEIQTPTTLKNKIFNQINMDNQTKEIELKPVSPIKTWWVAASLIISASSLLGNVYLGSQTETLKTQLSQITKTNNRLTYENLINRANYRSASEQLSLLHKHGNKTTHLEGLDLAKEASAMIYWNSESKDLFVSIDNLPKLPAGKQYQLWAMADGKPVNAGLLALEFQNNSLIKMNDVANAQAFAISLEKIGGSATPDMKAIYVLGTI
ncbi:MAG: anti-sigma factor domain-containing protein [Cytophagales bacterium]